MAGPEFWQTRMGQVFFEGTMPALVRELKKLNENLDRFTTSFQEEEKKKAKTDVTHILHEGLPICHFSQEVPEKWPPGHTWVREGDENVNCEGCAGGGKT